MPVVTVTLIDGYDEATRRRLGETLTDAVRATIAAPLDGVTVILEEVAPGNYLRGRTPRRPGPPLPDPAQTVRDFLAAMEARDLDRARDFLAEGFEMTFPGEARFTRLEDLVAWAKDRYRSVAKTIESIETLPSADGVTVFCRGHLAGAWPDGSPFDGIRFIDRFELADGKLTRQEVWNDLAEVAVKP